MRLWKTGLSAALGAITLAAPAAGQVSLPIGVEPPLPNVLLLLDSSGSMSYKPDGTLPVCTTPGNNFEMSRWGILTEVLTGSIQNKGCFADNRNTATFTNEFRLSGIDPYDKGYFLPYFRYTSNTCMPTPGVLPFSVFQWSNQPIRHRPWNGPMSNNGACDDGNNAVQWSQATDGLLDVYRDRVRFSLMMFDSHPHPGIGFVGTATNAQSGFNGLWSYFPGWQSGGTPATGNPAGCAMSQFEVGARNFAAPPWEGRMVPFGEPGAPLADVRYTNDRIQEVVTALRPYGATPLGGLMADAYTYFFVDNSNHPDPQTSGKFAPAGDPFFQGGCRKAFIILLSDGEPNLDLKPHCEALGGNCPYLDPEDYAYYLQHPQLTPPAPVPAKAINASNIEPITTFVIGFGLSQAGPIDCDTLQMPQDNQPGGKCVGATGTLKACCKLSEIAYNGGSGKAFYADDVTSLKAALDAVLAQITGQTTSRTVPIFASAAGTLAKQSNATAVSYEFTSSFVPKPGELWSGNLERHRWCCSNDAQCNDPGGGNGPLKPILQDMKPSKGDDFDDNVNGNPNETPARNFLTVIGDPLVGGAVGSQRSIRTNMAVDDGLGIYDGTTVTGSDLTIANTVKTSPASMNLVPMPVACTDPAMGATSSGDCAFRLMMWELGNSNGIKSREGVEFGAIYHSTPALIGAPSALVRDASYELFAEANATRPLMLYTATTDGQLHAFKVASNDATDTDEVDSLKNNELWSFLPPYVLPGLLSQYPAQQQILLDGRPVVKDVVFERTTTQALAAGGAGGATWKTVLVAGGYLGGGFYYALDVTDPEQPEFLWQLSKDSANQPLFGSISGTPAIATIAYKDGATVKETAVAILPGGEGSQAAQNNCTRQNTNFTHVVSGGSVGDPTAIGAYTPDSVIDCWQDGPSKTLTIVRLFDGKVLMQFRANLASGNALLPGTLTKNVPFDSPIVGTPIPYPGGTGDVANRIYVGDASGTLWRVDLSKADPTQWNVHLMFDAYPNQVPVPNDDREPIAVTPVVSVDEQGNTVLVFATGDQEQFTGIDAEGRVWSLTELPEPKGNAPFTVYPNWYLSEASGTLNPGERVTGPMTIFDGVAYFATFSPSDPNVDACGNQAGAAVWVVDYKDPKSGDVRPIPRYLQSPGPPPTFTDRLDQGAGTIIFGVTVAAEPSCTDDTVVTDDYVGQHTTIAQSVPPQFKILFHTGTSDEPPGPPGPPDTPTGQILLPPPTAQAMIDSWASVVE
jgi:type IV pilus assembly protein PilY1